MGRLRSEAAMPPRRPAEVMKPPISRHPNTQVLARAIRATLDGMPVEGDSDVSAVLAAASLSPLDKLNALLDTPLLDTAERGGPLEPFKKFARTDPEKAQVASRAPCPPWIPLDDLGRPLAPLAGCGFGGRRNFLAAAFPCSARPLQLTNPTYKSPPHVLFGVAVRLTAHLRIRGGSASNIWNFEIGFAFPPYYPR